MQKKFFLLSFIVILICSCGNKGKKSYDEMGSGGLTQRTENLQANLRSFVSKGVIIGQQYGTLEGIGYREDSVRHGDIYSITNDYPGCNAYELAGIGEGKKVNTDGIAFDAIRKDALDNFKHGCLTIMTWSGRFDHEDNEKFKNEIKNLANFLGSLQDGYGIKAPVLLIPFPRRGHSWYSNLTAEAYKDLYDKTVDALRDEDVSNVIFGYSFDEKTTSEELSQNIPDGVDVVEYYAKGRDFSQILPVLTSAAQDRNMVPALAVDVEGDTDSTFFSKIILPVIHQYRLSYICFGANTGEPKNAHYCVPYPGCPNALIHDFMALYNDKSTIFRRKLNGLYLKKE